MKFYIEITLLPCVDIDIYFLWAKLYQQIHLALVEVRNGNDTSPVAVAFPEYDGEKPHLGNKLRLFAASKTSLEMLNIQKWLAQLRDYLHITMVRDVPVNVRSYVCFKRWQGNSNIKRLARRISTRKKIDETEALKNLINFKEEVINAPFIHIRSLSGGRCFRLFIIKKEAGQMIDGCFSLYGLSSTATVPMF